ncbi:la-related protein 6-like [Limulus polyphemus]|uniref:La-related protein 6-like n=1 Tax=Limulus polyphemus TaxID=6850 RepID=A0ABM1BVK2_LIMPO|nr:la-related protein 6-like [Limulus polyphemus]
MPVPEEVDLIYSNKEISVNEMTRRRFDSTSSSENEEFVDAECDFISTGELMSSTDRESLVEGDFHQTGSDSGVDSSNASEDFQAPSQELVKKIVREVEFLFSDENILRESFLLKHIRRNKQGYVSLRLVASFRKVKRLSKDWRIVAYSLQQSENLELNKEETKVKRKLPLPDKSDSSVRSVVAYNLPSDHPTAENVKELFSKCGDIAFVTILNPGNNIPADIKRFLPRVGSSVCAVIEFTKLEAAKKAVVELDCSDTDWRSMRVVPLATNKSNKNEFSEKMKKVDIGDKRKKRDKLSRTEQWKSETLNMSVSKTESCQGMMQGLDCTSNSSSDFLTSSTKPIRWINRRIQKEKQLLNHANNHERKTILDANNQESAKCEYGVYSSPPRASWMQRRRETGTFVQVHNSRLIPEGVIRLPRGPSGAKGFDSRTLKSAFNTRVSVC